MSWSSVVVTRRREAGRGNPPHRQIHASDFWTRSSALHSCRLFHARALLLSPPLLKMPPVRFEPSTIKNKIKREEIANKQKKTKRQEKLKRRLAQAKLEANDPLVKKVHKFDIIPTCPYLISRAGVETSCTKRPSHSRQLPGVRSVLPHRKPKRRTRSRTLHSHPRCFHRRKRPARTATSGRVRR